MWSIVVTPRSSSGRAEALVEKSLLTPRDRGGTRAVERGLRVKTAKTKEGRRGRRAKRHHAILDSVAPRRVGHAAALRSRSTTATGPTGSTGTPAVPGRHRATRSRLLLRGGDEGGRGIGRPIFAAPQCQ